MNLLWNKGEEIITKISRNQKIAFISALIAGFLSHGYAMANNYIYHDATILNGLGTTFGLGRWALGYVGEINDLMFGNFNLPFFNVVFSLIFIAISAMYVVKALNAKSEFLCAFIGAIFAVYPVVTSTFAYNFSATYYFIALLLAVMSVEKLSYEKSDKKSIAISVAFLTISAGFYQAYLSVAVTLALSIILIDLLKGESELKDIISKGVRYVVTFIASLVMYLIINKISIVIMKPPATGYQGAENMGALSIAKLPGRFIQTYLHFFYIKWNGINAAFCMWVFIGLFLCASIAIIVYYIVKEKINTINLALFALGILVMPIAVNLVYLMSTDDNYSIHTLMRFATVFVLITPAAIVDMFMNKADAEGAIKVPLKSINVLTSASSILLTVIVLSYIYTNNVAYLKMNLVQEEMTAFFTVLEARICDAEGFSDDMAVVFSGEFGKSDNNIYNMNEMYKDTVLLGYEYNVSDLINRESWKRYMAYHTGFAPDIIDMPGDIAETDEFASMSVYPDAGSVKVINGIAVVKFSE